MDPGPARLFLEALVVTWYVGPFLSRKNDAQKNLRLFSMAGTRSLKKLHPFPRTSIDHFNSPQWSCLLAGHSGLHLVQLQAIKKGL